MPFGPPITPPKNEITPFLEKSPNFIRVGVMGWPNGTILSALVQSSIYVGSIIGSVYVRKGRTIGFEFLMLHFYSNWNFVDQNFICVERQTDRQTDKQTDILNRVAKTSLWQTLMVLPPANI